MQGLFLKRLIFAALLAVVCAFAIWQAAAVGFSRSLAHAAAQAGDITTADRAISWAPRDAEPYSVRGIVLQRLESYDESCRALERAIYLRPRDYFLWMLLGVSRDLNQDQEGAIRALQQAIALSPAYAKSHWLLGNLLLRANKTDEAVQQLRFAASSDETLLPNVIDLMWGVYRHDPRQTVGAVQPQTGNARMALAIFFARHGEGAPALEQFRSVKSPSRESVQSLMNELLNARLFAEAYEIWAVIHGSPASKSAILNPGFEEDIAVGQTGFGWQIAENPANVIMSADPSEFQSGSKSLRIDFRGDSNPTAPLISQIVLVSARAGYQLTFQAKSKDLTSAGLPQIAVVDLSDEKGNALATSAQIASAGDWRAFTMDFTTGEKTTAVRLVLNRQGCGSNPCAAFGTFWLDSFELKAMASKAPASANTAGPAK